ncbi:MAG: GrpB family protein [Ignavibacteriales bacterium]|nr:GrpB family protein [Ignavibacteriales bacterium]
MGKSLQERIEELVREEISIVLYDPHWPALFEQESSFLRRKLLEQLVRRIEHFGSTAVPGLAAKPVIDILVEVTDLEETKKIIAPLLEAEGYEYFWRPSVGDQPPYYAWFIKRNADGKRTHHIHMVEANSALWDMLYFRDYLRLFPDEAHRYEQLKRSLSELYSHDRATYTNEKTQYITSITKKAEEYFAKGNSPPVS